MGQRGRRRGVGGGGGPCGGGGVNFGGSGIPPEAGNLEVLLVEEDVGLPGLEFDRGVEELLVEGGDRRDRPVAQPLGRGVRFPRSPYLGEGELLASCFARTSRSAWSRARRSGSAAGLRSTSQAESFARMASASCRRSWSTVLPAGGWAAGAALASKGVGGGPRERCP